MHVSRLLTRTRAQLREHIDQQLEATAPSDLPRELRAIRATRTVSHGQAVRGRGRAATTG